MKCNDEIMSSLQAENLSLEREVANKNLIIENLEKKLKVLEENINEKEAEIENQRKDSSQLRENILSLKGEIKDHERREKISLEKETGKKKLEEEVRKQN